MEYLELISVPAIVGIVYAIVEVIKRCTGNSEKVKKFLPVIAAGLGIICGIVCYFAIPSIVPASNVVVAIVIGAASGLTATGTNQVVKQLTKEDAEDENDGKGTN